jgi:type I restriction enzyme, S subunit
MSEPRLPRGWKWIRLGELIKLSNGKGVTKKDLDGLHPYPAYGSSGILGRVRKALVTETTLAIGRVGACGQVQKVEVPAWISDNAMYDSHKHASFDWDYLFWFLCFSDLGRFASRTTQPSLPQGPILELQLSLPPLPVQERIVEILQKADGVRRKRQEALSLADAILSSAFIAMFGDPRANSRGFKVTSLGQLADVRSGVTKGRKLGSKETIEAPYLRVANVQDGYLDLSEIKTIKVLPEDLDKYHLEDGDILMTEGGDPDKLGRGCIWRSEVEGCIHQNHVFRVRTVRSQLAPGYLAALLRTQYAKEYFLRCAKRTSNLASINSTQVKGFPIPLPPITLQSKFVSAVEQWEQIHQRLTNGLAESKKLFQGLMQQAFSGELTAVWEAARADEIAAEQRQRERLPRLALLDFVHERQRRRPSEPILITSLMKYVFLLQKEGTTGQPLYHFVPYKYGPFARELYQDLETLAAEGFIAVTESDEERTEIALAPSKEATVQEVIAKLPESFRADVTRVLEQYGSLSHNQLLATVYEKYPAYARKSSLRRRRSS